LHLIDHLIATVAEHLLQIKRIITLVEMTTWSDLGFVPKAEIHGDSIKSAIFNEREQLERPNQPPLSKFQDIHVLPEH
jgi:hypothetical protein